MTTLTELKNLADATLQIVLCTPPELWQDTDIDRLQRYKQYLAASRRIEDSEREIESLREQLTAMTTERAEPVAWMYQRHTINLMSQLDWYDEVEFVQPPSDDDVFRNITPLFTHPAQSRDSIIEECAEVCDDLRQEWAGLKVGAYDGRYDMMEEAATVCEDAIRALKGKK